MIISSKEYPGSFNGAWAMYLSRGERLALRIHRVLRPRRLLSLLFVLVMTVSAALIMWMLYVYHLGDHFVPVFGAFVLVFWLIWLVPSRVQYVLDNACGDGRIIQPHLPYSMPYRFFVASLDEQMSDIALCENVITIAITEYQMAMRQNGDDPYWWHRVDCRGAWNAQKEKFLSGVRQQCGSDTRARCEVRIGLYEKSLVNVQRSSVNAQWTRLNKLREALTEQICRYEDLTDLLEQGSG